MVPLDGIRAVSLAINLPGPLAVASLRDMGARIVKVEPPEGDPLARARPEWYRSLHAGVEVAALNLKEPTDRNRLETWLAEADLLLTASRAAGLGRLGLDWPRLRERYPRLCYVAITGYPPPSDHLPGHDLNYQARAGLVRPPQLPRTCVADVAGAQQAVTAALALLLARERGGGGGMATVSLAEAAAYFAGPLRHGLTADGGPLGGGFAGYNLYPAREGWVAVAALEPHFGERLARELGLPQANRDALASAFGLKTADEWESWAAVRDLPVTAVRDMPTRVLPVKHPPG